jgi:hypothetical protein
MRIWLPKRQSQTSPGVTLVKGRMATYKPTTMRNLVELRRVDALGPAGHVV